MKYILDKTILALYILSIILFSAYNNYTNIPKYLGTALIALFLFRVISGNKAIILFREYNIIASWMCFVTVASFMSDDMNYSFEMLFKLLLIISVSYVICNYLIWFDDFTFVYKYMFMSTLIMSIYVFANPTKFQIGGRVFGTLGNANLYGFVLLICCIYAVYMVFTSKLLFKLFYIASLPFMLHMIAETGSRKSIIALMIFISLFTIIFFKDNIAKKPIKAALVLILLCAGAVFGGTYIYNSKHFSRMDSLSHFVDNQSKVDDSTKGRIKLYKIGYDIFLKHPVFGVGLNNFPLIAKRDYHYFTETYAHSNYIELLADNGFIGFSIYYLFYISIIIRFVKLRKRCCRDSHWYVSQVLLLLILIFYDFAMVTYQEKIWWLVMTTLIGSTVMIRNNSQQQATFTQAA